jgi:hypothetical protein
VRLGGATGRAYNPRRFRPCVAATGGHGAVWR